MQVEEFYNILISQEDNFNIRYKSNIKYIKEFSAEICTISMINENDQTINIIKAQIVKNSYRDHIEARFYASLNITKISNILFPILVNNNRINYYDKNIDATIFYNKLCSHDKIESFNNELEFVFQSNSDLPKFIYNLNIFIEKYAEPFFAKWSNLEMILELIDRTSQLEFCEMVSHGSYVKAIIYKLMNRELYYREYIDGMVERAHARAIENSSDISKFQIYSCLFELRETLDKI